MKHSGYTARYTESRPSNFYNSTRIFLFIYKETIPGTQLGSGYEDFTLVFGFDVEICFDPLSTRNFLIFFCDFYFGLPSRIDRYNGQGVFERRLMRRLTKTGVLVDT